MCETRCAVGRCLSAISNTDRHGCLIPLNRYILDYWTHGQKKPLTRANGMREGELCIGNPANCNGSLLSPSLPHSLHPSLTPSPLPRSPTHPSTHAPTHLLNQTAHTSVCSGSHDTCCHFCSCTVSRSALLSPTILMVALGGCFDNFCHLMLPQRTSG